jgi:hypothetical protein
MSGMKRSVKRTERPSMGLADRSVGIAELPELLNFWNRSNIVRIATMPALGVRGWQRHTARTQLLGWPARRLALARRDAVSRETQRSRPTLLAMMLTSEGAMPVPPKTA